MVEDGSGYTGDVTFAKHLAEVAFYARHDSR